MYLEKNLVGIGAEAGGISAKIKTVQSMEGDVDVSQRKGKVITLYDIKLQLEYGGEAEEVLQSSKVLLKVFRQNERR